MEGPTITATIRSYKDGVISQLKERLRNYEYKVQPRLLNGSKPPGELIDHTDADGRGNPGTSDEVVNALPNLISWDEFEELSTAVISKKTGGRLS